MKLQEIQHKAQCIIHKWRDDDSAPYIEFVEELAHMIVPEPSEDLEEAADNYIGKVADDGWEWETHDIVEAFIAGAKWQEDQTPLLEDTVLFNKGVAAGKRLVMEEAVAVEVVVDKRDLRLIDSTQRCLFNAKRGDWLKIIIVKEDEK